MLSPSNPHVEYLRQLRICGAVPWAHGAIIRAYCPFHRGSGKTLWINAERGTWGCWSVRCGAGGGDLRQIAWHRGKSWKQATALFKMLRLDTFVLAPEEREQEEDRVAWPHLMAFAVDWHLAEQVVGLMYANAQQVAITPDIPPSYFPGCLAAPGDVEHDHWWDLQYLLVQRKQKPDWLEAYHVGYDRHSGELVFPIERPGGQLEGISRRKPVDGAPYVAVGTPYNRKDPNWQYLHVQKGHCLWGLKRARGIKKPDIVVVEGFLDVIRLAEFGFRAVAKMGPKLTVQQVQLLLAEDAERIVLWPDFDRPGLLGCAKDVNALLGQKPLAVVAPRGMVGKDPADYTRLIARTTFKRAEDPAAYLCRLPQYMTQAA